MTFDDITLVGVKYRIKTFELTIGGSQKHVVDNQLITSMTIVEDYDKYFFPYFEVVFGVPTEIYRLLQKNSEKIKANLNIQKSKFKDAVSLNVDTAQAFKNCINNTFYVYFTDTTPDLSEAEQKIVEKSGNKYGQIAMAKVLLYPDTYYTKYDMVVNAVLRNVTLADVTTYCLNKCGINRVLLSPPKNYKRYKQFIVTPISLKKQLERICNSYGMHESGTIIFFGLTRAYIIESNPKCTAYETNEFTITYILAKGTSKGTSQTGGCYENPSKRYNLINATTLNVNNNKQTSLKTGGSNIVSVDSSGRVSKSDSRSSTTTNVVIHEEGSDTLSALNSSINESEYVATATFANIDIDMITPNKQFIMTIDGVENRASYNGKYRLSKVVHVFEKDGNNFTVNTTAEFK